MTATAERLRVLLVDDSPIALAVLGRILALAPDMEVVGTARHGVEALELIPRLRPHVVCTDVHMPHMDGFALTEAIMAHHPLPVLVISVSVELGHDDRTIFRILDAGAIDIFPKPRHTGSSVDQTVAQALIQRIRILSGVVPIRRHARRTTLPTPVPVTPPVSSPGTVLPSSLSLPSPLPAQRPSYVVIGASTGGPQALAAIFSRLPASWPTPILCVQHIGEEFLDEMIFWMQRDSALPIRIATHMEQPRAGHIYFPPVRHHLALTATGHMTVIAPDGDTLHCPSVDRLFRSMADHHGSRTVAILLTGMGADGAQGMVNIRQQGGLTIAQDEESCVVFGMPRQAIEQGGACHVLHLDRIVPLLQRMV
jgi:two-component system chemotaxis response regulator CheB